MTAARRALTDPNELLYRQVHPQFIQKGRVSSQAFRPTPKDDGELSVSQGSRTSPEQAYQLYTQQRELHSAGTWSISVGQCMSLDLEVFADPLTTPIVDEAHAVVCFRGLATKKIQRLSKQLSAFAQGRGCQFAPR